MDGHRSWCWDLLCLLKRDGRSHADICGSIFYMQQNNVITKSACDEILRMLAQSPTPTSPNRCTSPAIERALTLQPGSQTRAELDSQIVHNVPQLSPAEASEYRHLHNQAFNLPSTVKLHPATGSSGAGRWLRHCFAGVPGIPSSTRGSTNMFLLPIRVEVGGKPTRAATLLLDTGSDFNILGLQLAELLHPNLDCSRPERLANTGGGHMDTLGKMLVRWWCEDERFSKRFEPSVFQISAGRLDVDAIIGWRDIVKLDLVRLNATGFVGFTSRPSRVDHTTAAYEQAAAEVRRQAEDDEMRRDEMRRNYQQRRSNYAHDHALRYAQAFAAQYQLRNGPEGLDRAYNTKYQEVYRQVYNDYPRHYPQ